MNVYPVPNYLRGHEFARRSGVRYQNWRDLAACRGEDPALFFPEDGNKHAVAKARAICAGCPVRTECLEHAVGFPEKHGVWGGLAERERWNMRPAQHITTTLQEEAA